MRKDTIKAEKTERKKSQLNYSTSAIVQMGKSSKDVRLHQILIFFTRKYAK